VPDAGRYTPPEVVKTGWDTIKRNPLAAVDAYGLGILIFEVFNGGFSGGDQAGKTTNIPPSMQPSYKRLCTANPKLRLSPGHFVEQGKKQGGFFQTPLIRMTEDIDSLGLKSDAEREEFIKCVYSTDLNNFAANMSPLAVSLKIFLMTSQRNSSR
jgi:hypothetical protein